jgi:hypothetical protein
MTLLFKLPVLLQPSSVAHLSLHLISQTWLLDHPTQVRTQQAQTTIRFCSSSGIRNNMWTQTRCSHPSWTACTSVGICYSLALCRFIATIGPYSVAVFAREDPGLPRSMVGSRGLASNEILKWRSSYMRLHKHFVTTPQVAVAAEKTRLCWNCSNACHVHEHVPKGINTIHERR